MAREAMRRRGRCPHLEEPSLREGTEAAGCSRSWRPGENRAGVPCGAKDSGAAAVWGTEYGDCSQVQELTGVRHIQATAHGVFWGDPERGESSQIQEQLTQARH